MLLHLGTAKHLDTKFSSRPSVFACWLFLPVTCMLAWLILHRYTVNALQRPSIEHVIHVGVYQRGGMARLVSYDGVEEIVVGTDYTHVASHNDKVCYKNSIFSREPNYIFRSYFKVLCIEASTYLGSLQKFRGNAEEFKRALSSWLQLIYSPGLHYMVKYWENILGREGENCVGKVIIRAHFTSQNSKIGISYRAWE